MIRATNRRCWEELPHLLPSSLRLWSFSPANGQVFLPSSKCSRRFSSARRNGELPPNRRAKRTGRHAGGHAPGHRGRRGKGRKACLYLASKIIRRGSSPQNRRQGNSRRTPISSRHDATSLCLHFPGRKRPGYRRAPPSSGISSMPRGMSPEYVFGNTHRPSRHATRRSNRRIPHGVGNPRQCSFLAAASILLPDSIKIADGIAHHDDQ